MLVFIRLNKSQFLRYDGWNDILRTMRKSMFVALIYAIKMYISHERNLHHFLVNRWQYTHHTPAMTTVDAIFSTQLFHNHTVWKTLCHWLTIRLLIMSEDCVCPQFEWRKSSVNYWFLVLSKWNNINLMY